MKVGVRAPPVRPGGRVRGDRDVGEIPEPVCDQHAARGVGWPQGLFKTDDGTGTKSKSLPEVSA